jgi:SPX domain protein involved in polyphosphate accumulation
MTYCAFSKILKKHDKCSGYQTRSAFIEIIVNKASFTNYPKVIEMISRRERLFEEASGYLVRAGNKELSEDERPFISTTHRLNEQVLSDDKEDDDSEDDHMPTTSSSKRPVVAIPPHHTKRQRKT